MRLMKPVLFALLPFVLASAASAKNEPREHGAHVHGAATLSLALDESYGRLEIHGAAETFIGFEYEPIGPVDKKKYADALMTFHTRLQERVRFDSSLGCKFTKEKLGMDRRGTHADFDAEYSIRCAKSPIGSKIVFDFSSAKGLRDLDITIVAGDLQKSAEYKGQSVTVELKP